MPLPRFFVKKNNDQSRFLVTILRLWLDFDLVLAIRRLFKVTDTFAKRPADFRKLSSPENNQNYDQYDYHFRHAKTKHCAPSAASVYYLGYYLIDTKKNQVLRCVMQTAGLEKLYLAFGYNASKNK